MQNGQARQNSVACNSLGGCWYLCLRHCLHFQHHLQSKHTLSVSSVSHAALLVCLMGVSQAATQQTQQAMQHM